MIKNKALNIKIIFRTYSKILKKTCLKYVKFSNIYLFYKSLENNFQKLFLKIVF